MRSVVFFFFLFGYPFRGWGVSGMYVLPSFYCTLCFLPPVETRVFVTCLFLGPARVLEVFVSFPGQFLVFAGTVGRWRGRS